MKRLAVVLALAVLASACGGGAETSSPETTGSPTTTVASSSTTSESEPAAPATTATSRTGTASTTTSGQPATTPADVESPATTMPSTASTTTPAASTTPIAQDAPSTSVATTQPAVGAEAPESTATSGPVKDDAPDAGQPFNPFRTSDPELRQCLISVFGPALHDELRDRQPNPAEDAAMEPCMAAFMRPDDSSSGYPAPEDPGPGEEASSGSRNDPDTSIDLARSTYPPHITGQVLLGYIPAPAGFDDCIISQIGGNRLGEIRSKQPPSGDESDLAAVCLFQLQVPISLLDSQGGQAGGDPGDDGGPVGPADPNSGQDEPTETIMVTYPSTSYPVAPGGTSGFFTTAQDADIALSAFGFNDTGGPLEFNRPSGLTSDGTRLVMTDVFNNRVLIWNTAPTHGGQAPDLVLGQPNFTTNEPGTGRHQLNWPVSASTDGTRLAVTDTMNDRILIWNEFPTSNAEPADIVLQGGSSANASKSTISWPWGVWTDGSRLVVSSTVSASLLIWNTFPTYDGQPADLLLTGSGDIGTPRQITSDGNSLIVGDHNATAGGKDQAGTFFWTSFPTIDDQPYDFFVVDPLGEKLTAPWLRGDFTADGRLVMMGDTLHIWDDLPQLASDRPVLSNLGQANAGGYDFRWGDFSTVAVAGKRVYITTNGSTLVGYDSIPTSATQIPDFVMGATDLYVDGNVENFVMSNPVPVSNGTSLFASSDFDGSMFVWKNLPDESGAAPDVIYHFCRYQNEETARRHQCEGRFSPWDNTLHGDTFALAGRDRLMIWTELPLEGNLPAYDFEGGIGTVRFDELTGVAMDDTYFYVADKRADVVHVWAGIPDGTHDPVATLSVSRPNRLSSDGTWLAVNSTADGGTQVFRVDQIVSSGSSSTLGGSSMFNLPEGTSVDNGHVFVADTGNSQVLVWRDVADALAGLPADVILGASGASDTQPEITRNQMFWPAASSFDGDYLWVGERKFSGRLVRFSPIG